MSEEQAANGSGAAPSGDPPVNRPYSAGAYGDGPYGEPPIGDDDDVRHKPTIEPYVPWTMPEEDALELPQSPTVYTSRDGERNPVARHRSGLGKLIQAERQKQADEAKARLDIHGHFAAFCESARALKQAESAFKAAQLAYAEAVKRLSEEAVK